MNLDCPFCGLDQPGTLSALHEDHLEYQSTLSSYDGTKRWYSCSVCGGVYCRDKMLKVWKMSAQTYTRFLEQGLIEDQLNS